MAEIRGRQNIVTMRQIFFQEIEEFRRLGPRGLIVSVVGFGHIGTCIGALLASKGITVFGIDPNDKLVEEINRGKTSIEEPQLEQYVREASRSNHLKASFGFDSISLSDIVIVTVGTPLDENHGADLGPIKAACECIGTKLKAGTVVIVKSTVPPSSTEGWVKDLLEENSGLVAGEQFGLVFSPERISEGNAIKELQRIPVVVGGVDAKSSAIAAAFWEDTLGVETVAVGSPTAAELVKLADNQWIDLNVALANEIALVSDKLNVDAFEVIKAANSLPKGQHLVNILAPSVGVGGYCLPKDPWFLHRVGTENGLELKTPICSREVNDRMPEHAFNHVRECLSHFQVELLNARVAVLGLAYKNDTGDARSTPAEPFLKLLEQSGCSVTVFDPLVSQENIRRITNAPIGQDILSTVEGADLIACLAAHQQFRGTSLSDLKNRTKENCWFFDGRHGFDPAAVSEAGFLYTGIGLRIHGAEPSAYR